MKVIILFFVVFLGGCSSTLLSVTSSLGDDLFPEKTKGKKENEVVIFLLN